MGVIKRQGIKNTVITYIGIIIGAVNIIFVQPKLLSEEELGLTRLLYDFAYLIGLAVPLGLPNIIVKYFPFFKDKENKHNGFAGFVLLIFLIGFIISAAALLIFKPTITSLYIDDAALFVNYFSFIIPFTFIVSAITITTAYCQALFKSTIPSFLNDICLRLGVILITILYFNKIITLDYYVYCFIGLYAIELLAILIYILIVDKLSFIPNKNLFKKYSAKQMLRFGLLLCLASFASIALRKIDVIILGTTDLKLVAVYTTAIFIASFIEVPLGALERISHTKIADSFAKNNFTEIEKIYKDSVKYLLLIGGLLFIGINACTKYIYEIGQLPNSYLDCINVVYIVSLGALINISTGINSAIMFYSKHYVLGTTLLVLTLVITILLNIFLIPIYGIYGAAIASVAASLIYNMVKFVFIYRKFKFQPYTIKSFVIFVIIVICSFVGFIFPELSNNSFVNLFIKGSVVTTIYIAAIYQLKLAPEIFTGIKNRLIKK
ncbi:MAG: polysaccharide biosynthesis C-terminal domain-containing protein [Bacteroidota bacterium]|nr:polysaccharide biosynthesis C-terminal domain-containing protein [Bacteroidota bacterium]MDP3144653.1 polysaccharide biosynthesis C-terminal domain-containing protein [Bacteroidota bacterium]